MRYIKILLFAFLLTLSLTACDGRKTPAVTTAGDTTIPDATPSPIKSTETTALPVTETRATTAPITTAAVSAPIAEPLTEIANGNGYFYSAYENNLAPNAADPFILEHDGTYYLYHTGGMEFTVRTSTDLVSWTKQKEPILQLSDLGWAEQKGWAPEVHAYNGKFYLVFSAQGYNGIHSIDIAVCDTPNGKFEALNKSKPFFAPTEYGVIDGNLFFDDDGRIYMYYSKGHSRNIVNGKHMSEIWGVELNPDFSGIIGEPVLIATPTQSWERTSGEPLWNEGPVVFKENGTYYLLYSANYFVTQHYAVGYATSDTPLRLFDKPDNCRILAGNGKTVTGPGHCNILRSPDGSEIYIVYHVHTVPPNSDKGRSLAIDRLVIRKDGTPAVDGPSETRRLLPSGVGDYVHLHDGFTCRVTGESAEIPSGSAIENLFDGICKGMVSGILSLGDGGSIEITMDEPQNILSIWLYPATMQEYVPAKADVVINGKYRINEVAFGGKLGQGVEISLSNLPAGTAVEDLRITLHTADGRQYAALCEIVLVTKY